jgi:hypothetical protein
MVICVALGGGVGWWWAAPDWRGVVTLGATALTQWGRSAPFGFVAGVVLFLPGLVWQALFASPTARGVGWGSALGLSLAFLPVLWLGVATFGGQLSPLVLGMVYGALAMVYGIWKFKRFNREGAKGAKKTLFFPARSLRLRRLRLWRWFQHHALLIAILGISLTLRFLAIRDLVFPAWVDSPHHALITQVLVSTGGLPADYGPLLPGAQLVYHFGFHALAAAFHWGVGQPIPEVLLWLGQILNGLMPLAAYDTTRALTGHKRAGLGAAFILAVVANFPGYHVTWGRYPHLMAMLIFAAALTSAWRTLRCPEPRPADWIALGLLAAGLFLTHYPAATIFAVFFAVLWLFSPTRQSGLWAALLALLLAAPWLWRLALDYAPRLWATPTAFISTGEERNFPLDFFDLPLERGWLLVSGLTFLVALARRERPLLWLAAGLGVSAALILGVGSWLVSPRVLAISIFLPLSIGAGWGVSLVWDLADQWGRAEGRWRWLAGGGLSAWLGLCAVYGLGAGVPNQINIINPVTVLATTPDQRALEWIRANTPPDAVFAVNGWEWLPGIWAGSDGGAWLGIVTGRRVTLPPIDYVYARQTRQTVNEFNRRLIALTDFAAPEALALFREAGVTHIYIGPRGGYLRPEAFSNQPAYALLYTDGQAWVFTLKPSEP